MGGYSLWNQARQFPTGYNLEYLIVLDSLHCLESMALPDVVIACLFSLILCSQYSPPVCLTIITCVHFYIPAILTYFHFVFSCKLFLFPHILCLLFHSLEFHLIDSSFKSFQTLIIFFNMFTIWHSIWTRSILECLPHILENVEF